jgi:hypothetical protein
MEPADLSSEKYLCALSSQKWIPKQKTVLEHSLLCKIAFGNPHFFTQSNVFS